jgi:hypothetical protein
MSDQTPGSGNDSRAGTLLAIAGACGFLLAIAVIVAAVIIGGTAAALMLSVLAALIGIAALVFMRLASRR